MYLKPFPKSKSPDSVYKSTPIKSVPLKSLSDLTFWDPNNLNPFQEAPSYSLCDTNGKKISLSEWIKGKTRQIKYYPEREYFMILEHLGIETAIWELSIYRNNIPSEYIGSSFFTNYLYAQQGFNLLNQKFICNKLTNAEIKDELSFLQYSLTLDNIILMTSKIPSIITATTSTTPFPNNSSPAQKGIKCPVCDSPMKLRNGKFGPFYGCMKYPECVALVSLDGIPNKKTALLINANKKKSKIQEKATTISATNKTKISFNDDIDDRLDGLDFSENE